MIDAHCHLEQKNYENDLDEVIKMCKEKGMKAVVSSCAHPRDFDRAMEIEEKYRGFVFITLGIHPEYIKEFSEDQISEYIEKIKSVKDRIVGIGEIGLDYNWVKEPDQQERQKELFRKMLRLAKELDKPVVIHSRDSHEDTFSILDEQNPEKVLWHFFGVTRLLDQIKKKGWSISLGPIIRRSKTYRKIARDMPIEKIMLETDSPWFEQEGQEKGYPFNVIVSAETIAKMKKLEINEVIQKTTENAIEFYNLKL